jgi:hypothetical protein
LGDGRAGREGGGRDRDRTCDPYHVKSNARTVCKIGKKSSTEEFLATIEISISDVHFLKHQRKQ